MKLLKLFLFIVLLSLLSISVSASDGCFLNEDCIWWAFSSGVPVDGVNITIYDPSGNVLVTDAAMSSVDSETFIYQYNHNVTGNHLGLATFYNSSGVIVTSAQSLQVKMLEIGASNSSVNMEGILLLLGILSLGCVLLFSAYKIQLEDRGVLQILLIIFAILLFIMIPKVALDYKDHCSLVPTNMTSEATGVNYSYDYVCVENTNNTASTFYVLMIRFAWVLAFYSGMYGLFILYKIIKERTKW